MFIDFSQRGKEREREASMGKRNVDQLPPIHVPIGNGTRNLGVCPDQESNLQTFVVQDDASTT